MLMSFSIIFCGVGMYIVPKSTTKHCFFKFVCRLGLASRAHYYRGAMISHSKTVLVELLLSAEKY